MRESTLSHDSKVQHVVNQVRQVTSSGKPFKFLKKSVSHFVPNPHHDGSQEPVIDIRPLCELLHVDKERRIAVAEPGLTFVDLVDKLLPLGFIPQTVPELKGITLGGAVSGCSVESMSYHLGGFHDSCLEYEVVSSSGEVLTCSREQDPELFEMLHGSYGTLGILTKITFKILPALPYVRMSYVHLHNFDEYWAFLQERMAARDFDFIDGLIHSPSHFVACLGRMVPSVPFLNRYDRGNIYYKSTQHLGEDYLRLSDYFFRYDTECHWLSRTVPPLEWKAVRWALGPLFLGSTNLVSWSNRLAPLLRMKRRPEVVVDVFVPGYNFAEFYKWYEKTFDFWPLWVVPYKAPLLYPWISDEHQERIKDTLLVDCAIYGKPNNDPGLDLSEVLEKKVFQLNGIKTLISRNHYTEQEFWSIYSRRRYESAKHRLDPANVQGGLFERFQKSGALR